MSHNLEALTPFDFESLAKTVLDASLGLDLEIYKSGRDQGIDLRHAWSGKEGELIVQCKHTPEATIRSLQRQFKNEELPKISKLKPNRYVVFTSAALSKANKAALKRDMAPYILREGDIYGRQQIEHFLENNPDAVRSHLRLWLTSSSVLQAVLRQDVAMRSSDLMGRIEAQLPIFVDTPSLPRAQEILRRRRVCLISGPPGIGKTTLAHILCAELMADGYEAVHVASRISEARNHWQADKKQVFIFDDFLGRSAKGDNLDRNEDEDIIRFAEKVFSTPDKCFIMTTRGYILGQARVIYERLSSPTLRLSECLLELEDLDLRSRAMILYNHVWTTNLDPSKKALFADKDNFWPILRSKNYSPRLISVSLEIYSNGLDDSKLTAPQLMLRNLNRPLDLWHHAISRDLSDEARGLLDLMGTIGAQVSLSKLRYMWAELGDPRSEATVEDRFEAILEILEGDFIAVGGSGDDPMLMTANPSIDDYMAFRLRDRVRLLATFLLQTPSHRHVEGIQRVFEKRLDFDEKDTREGAWGESIQQKVFAAYMRLLHEPDPLGVGRLNAGQERCRRLTSLWSVATSGTEIEAVLKLTSELIECIDEGSAMFDWDCVDDIVGLLIQLEGHPEASLAQGRLVAELESAVRATLGTWDGAQESLSEVQRLADPGQLNLESLIEEALHDHVIEALKEWQHIDEDNEGRRLDGMVDSELEGMLEYASNYSEPERTFPGYDQASNYAIAVSRRRELRRGSQWDGTTARSTTADFDVAGLMKGLR